MFHLVNAFCVGLFFIFLPRFVTSQTDHRTSIVTLIKLNSSVPKVQILQECESKPFDASDGSIDYVGLYYCYFGEVKPLAWILILLWTCFIFYVLGSTSEDFFCPALLRISTRLHLSPNIAGVTFLALGNGAPDIFTSFVAVNQGLFSQALGELMGNFLLCMTIVGAGLFVSTSVVGSVILLSSKSVKPTRRPFLRDVLAFIGAVILIVGILSDNIISFMEAFSLVLYYCVYVLIVVVGRLVYQRHKRLSTLDAPSRADSFVTSEESKRLLDDVELTLESSVPYLGNIQNAEPSKFHCMLRDVKEYFEWNDMTKAERIIFWCLFPLMVTRHLTVPWMKEGKKLRVLAIIQPICMGLFCITIFEGTKDYGTEILAWHLYIGVFPVWVGVLLFGMCIGLIVCFTSNNNDLPRFYFIIYIPLSLIMSVLWIYLAANELVNILKAVGTILNISPAILGLTVLAWGNSVADMVSNTIIARKGLPQMALGACHAAPLCNMLLGLGISLTYYIARTGGNFILEDASFLPNTVFFAVLSLIVTLGFTLMCTVARQFVLEKWVGVTLIFLYFLFSVLSVMVEMGLILHDTNIWWRITHL